ncbi:MAG: uroporphyrinogen-III synthase [Sphingomicrobium sp.]
MSKIVILRPEPGASATLARAEAAGLEAVAIPLFEVAAIDWVAPDAAEYDALLLTSANAVRHGGIQLASLSGLPAYCVGAATAAAAQQAGLGIADTGTGNAADLAGRLPEELRFLHLTGRNHRAMAAVTEIAVYDSVAIDPTPSLDALIGGVAMVHSPRAGARLAELVETRGNIAIAAISPAAAAACGTGWRAVQSVTTPTDAALLELAAALWQKLKA